MKWLTREPSRDPSLAEGLRRIEAESDANDLDLLRQRIVAAAVPRLARRRGPTTRWWEWIDRWIPVAVPVGVAASLAAALLLPGSGDIARSQGYTIDALPESTLVTAAYSDEAGGEQVAAGLIAPQGGDWLLEQAVIQ